MTDLDKELNSTMTAVAEIRNVQLNEKISETTYQILHPETKADQVITNTDKRFVSDSEKEMWTESALANVDSLHYKGEWTRGETYKKNDVVYYTTANVTVNGGLTSETENITMFYVYTSESESVATVANQPTYNKLTNSPNPWMNIDFRSYLASQANAVRIEESLAASNQEVLITFVVQDTAEFKTICVDDEFKYNPATSTLTVKNIIANVKGDLDGTAKNAINYVTYERDENGNKVTNGTVGSAEIDDTIVGIKKRLDGITNGSGGAILGNKLTVKKDGVEEFSFDGSTPEELDIKQTYATAEITDLLESTKQKIDLKWLPDSILGQLEYQGTWDASQTNAAIADIEKGWYYITTVAGNYSPDGTLEEESASTVPYYYQIGDWAVYNGTTWDKVDNTDAVTMVNSQIGAIETYKGNWTAERQYHRGDIVKYDNKLYLCATNHISATSFSSANWELFGRSYVGINGIKVEDDNIGHDITTTAAQTKETQTLNSGDTFNIPSLTRDDWGHVTGLDILPYQLGSDFIDTTRQILLNGSEILAGSGESKNKPLNLNGDNLYIELKYGNDILTVEHKTTGQGEKDLQLDEGDGILYAGESFKVPSIKVDAAGHITEAELKEITLAESPFKHEHFNITKDASGAQVISAYSETDYNALANKDLKFYLGTVKPEGTKQMNFNGKFNAAELLQKGNIVLDRSTTIKFGTNFKNEDITASYNINTNSYEMNDHMTAGVYSAMAVNSKGVVTAGGHIVEFGTVEDADPSDSLAIGGLFFRMHSTNDNNA